jgi:hypothetical protein
LEKIAVKENAPVGIKSTEAGETGATLLDIFTFPLATCVID